MEQIGIVDMTKITARNMHELLMQLANHIEKLEEENAELRNKLQEQSE